MEECKKTECSELSDSGVEFPRSGKSQIETDKSTYIVICADKSQAERETERRHDGNSAVVDWIKRESNTYEMDELYVEENFEIGPTEVQPPHPVIIPKVLNKAESHINEKEEMIEERCGDCDASECGCKHTISLAAWPINRTEEPSVPSVQYYRKKPKLSEAVTKDKIILAKKSSIDLESFLEECRKRDISGSLIINYSTNRQTTLIDYTIFNLILEHTVNANDHSFDKVKEYAENKLTINVIKDIEKRTQNRIHDELWHSMRQARITAANIYEATKCMSSNEVLVQSILGGYILPVTVAYNRRKRLENAVLKQLEADLNTKINKCGFILINPFIGASPAGECDDFVVEIKYPVSEKAFNNYIKNSKVCMKFRAQIMIQMHAAKKNKGLFCVADPKFEDNKLVHKHWVYYDKLLVKALLEEAEDFWKKYIFPKVLESVK